MNTSPVRHRRSIVSLLLGTLAMGGSFATLGAVILSDVAAAETAPAPAPESAARVQQAPETLSIETPPPPEELPELAQPEPKPAKKKRARKTAKVDFGRYEGY